MEMTNCESAIDYLDKSVKEDIGTRSGKWSRDELNDTTKIIKASVYPILKEGAGPGDVKRLLGTIKSGYGCWLDMVDNAFHKAVSKVPDDMKGNYMQVYGAFKMAQAFLFDIEKNKKAATNGHGKSN